MTVAPRARPSLPTSEAANLPEARAEHTTDKVLRLLAVVAGADAPMSARQLAEATGTPLSSVYRHLSVLREWELIAEDPSSGGFLVGPRALTLASAFYQQFALGELALGVMQRVMFQTGETVLLLIPAAGKVVCVESVESQRPLHYSFRRGVVIDRPLRGASAQAMLPYYSAAFIESALAQDGGVNPAQVFERREQIRAQGYAISEGEVDEGVVAVASAVLGKSGRLLGSLSIVAPTQRVPRARQLEYAAQVQAAAQEIGRLLKDGRGLL